MTAPVAGNGKRPAPLERYRREIDRCVKCGACRAVCPSFLQERGESQSARGRMALIKAVLDRSLPVSDIFRDRLATCTGCLACEAACPSNVPVTEIIQAAKEQAIEEAGTGLITRLVSAITRQPILFRASAWLAPVALHYSGNKGRRKKEEGRGRSGSRQDALPVAGKGTVLFYPGCAIEHFQPEVGAMAVAVLEKLGYSVIIPEGLVCCGRPLLSLGDRKAAADLAERNRAVFEAAQADAIVTACASCSLTFKKEYRRLLAGKELPQVQDIHEFLASRLSGVELAAQERTITWHDPCHLTRGQGLGKAARSILRAIPGLELREMQDADRCCGFGGVMRITHHRLSDSISNEKAANIGATKASAVVTGCPGCRMQISQALDRAGNSTPVLHTVQVLGAALGIADRGSRKGLKGSRGKGPGAGKV